MIRVACLQATGWLAGRRAGLSDAIALRLEEHLAHCADCSAEAMLLDGLREISDAGAASLPASARQRAVLHALAQAQRPLQRSAAQRSWLMPSAFGALSAVALVVLAVVLRAGSPMGDRVLSGELESAGRSLQSGAALAAEARLQTHNGARVALAHAKVELSKETQARWDSRTRLVHLERGSLAADVDPTLHQSFGVVTARFSVHVLGTSFQVSREQVKVARGRVEVVSPQGQRLALLGAGESWRLPTQVASKPVPPAPVTAPEPVAQVAPEVAVERVQPSTLDVDAQLERARQALGQREVGRAQKLLGPVLTASLSAKQRAEAWTLQAECALVAGDSRAAEAAYARVAQRFAALPAGENAAFAAARLSADRNSERGLVRYLARYPHGRFVKEANARLRELRGAVPPQP
ncbi:MAG TPA: FecR domain-containing protein [Polyangiales bacterium]|nr:FecR domain-containing protein [Polyangiales bacterium]